MKILCLYNNPIALALFEWIRSESHDVVLWSERPDCISWENEKYDLAISYTYKYILTDKELQSLQYNAVNIHNSYLPWNRGASPNLWSVIDGTPKGVTLHYMDEDLDKGFIIAQELVNIDNEKDTLKSSYEKLDLAAKNMFKKAFAYYPFWDGMKKEPDGSGTYHSVRDSKQITDKIQSYDILIKDFLVNDYI